MLGRTGRKPSFSPLAPIRGLLHAMGQVFARVLDLMSRKIEKRVVLLGLDNAGKTTTVYHLLW
jgi:hypothetical protein